MSEHSAKLKVKVTLHRDLPSQPPKLQYAKAPLSKTRLVLGTALLLLGAFWLWHSVVADSAAQIPADAALDPTSITTPAAAAQADAQADAPLAQHMAVAAERHDDTGTASEHVVDAAETVADDATATSAVPADSADTANRGPEHTSTEQAPGSQPPAAQHAMSSTATPASALSQQDTQRTVAADGSAKLPTGFSRIVLAADMEQLEPGRPVAQLVAKKDIQRLYLFTELKGYAGQQLRHRWFFKGELQTEAVLTIEDSPWRTYSEKWLLPDQLGAWRVEIIDQQQNVLYSHDFQYQ